VGGQTEVVELPESLDTQPQLPFNNYAAEAETFMGHLPRLQQPAGVRRRLQEVPRLRVLRVRVMDG
jgi:hypothetical protein